MEVIVEEIDNFIPKESKDTIKLTKDQFDKKIEELKIKFPSIIIYKIGDIRVLDCFKDVLYLEVPEYKQQIIEIVDINDQKQRTIFTLVDFDKFLETIKDDHMVIYNLKGQRMVVYSDHIYQEEKKNNEVCRDYV